MFGGLTMINSFLTEHMERLAASVLAQAERARAGSGHAGLKGAAIEVVVRNVLRQYVPSSFTVGTGQIANSAGALSPQMDVLVYDAAVFPHLSVNEDASVVVCCESVFAVVECKTEWRAQDVATHFQRFCSVELQSCGPWESRGATSAERVAYFVFNLNTPAAPDLEALKDVNRTVGVYNLTDRWCWHSPRRQESFDRLEGNAFELFLSHILQECMEKGPKEIGTFGESFRIVKEYFGWRDRRLKE
jgi:hypothetical protein